MNRGTQDGSDSSARDGEGRTAGDVVDHPWPPADGKSEQAVSEAQQLVGKIRRILGQSAFVPGPRNPRRP